MHAKMSLYITIETLEHNIAELKFDIISLNLIPRLCNSQSDVLLLKYTFS